MTTYLDHFDLRSEPFSKEIDDNKLWLPESKRELVDELVACVHERKHAIVTGEPGVGKTCVLRALRHARPDQAFRLTYCHNVTLGRRDFYRHVCHALNIPYGATAGDVFHSVSKHIEELARERTFPVLLVDEAHLMHQDTLDHLHILLNYAWDSKALLSLILIGLPDLNERLVMCRNRSLYSRLTYGLTIEPLSPSTAEYIRARLSAAGATKELFTADAIAISTRPHRAHCATSIVSRTTLFEAPPVENVNSLSATSSKPSFKLKLRPDPLGCDANTV